MWEAVERFHAITYFAPQVREAATAAGLKGFWMNYFATRAAPMGPVPAEVVESTFFYYGPARVRRAIPDAWRFSTPEQILRARYDGIDQCLRSTYRADQTPDAAASPHPGPGPRPSPEFVLDPASAAIMTEAADIARRAVEAADPMARTLFAGWLSLPWPDADAPHVQLWHACTLLRELRSGNHLIALAAEGLSGCEAVVSHVAAGGAPRAWIRDEAGWNPDDEAHAVDRLRRRGWLDIDGRITEAGRAGRQRIESLTDRLDLPVWEAVGEADAGHLFRLLSQLDAALPPDDQLDWEHHYPTETVA